MTGGLLKQPKVDQHKDLTTVVDLRRIDSRNCHNSASTTVRYGSHSPESAYAQMKLDAGFDDRSESTASVRLSQSGIFYYRGEMELQNPSNWFSWMKETDEIVRDLEIFTSSSSGPSKPPPHQSHLSYNSC